ncbi:MAG: hypothetical protein KAV00_07750 [Phycisphaerae bacterium]|nr:hypothetical protein [Phycisphaerae bacterium]
MPTLDGPDSALPGDVLDETLGVYCQNTYAREINLILTEKEHEQIRARNADGSRPDLTSYYHSLQTQQQRHRFLKVIALGWHETFHFCQFLMTSCGAFLKLREGDMFARRMGALAKNGGMPQQRVDDWLTQQSHEANDPFHPLAQERFWSLWGGWNGTPGSIVPVAHGTSLVGYEDVADPNGIPRVYLSDNGEWRPFGAKVLLEAWAHSVCRSNLATSLSAESSVVFNSRHGWPYTALDQVFTRLWPSVGGTTRFADMHFFIAWIAYHALNAPPPDVDPYDFGTKPDDSPGLRAARLIAEIELHAASLTPFNREALLRFIMGVDHRQHGGTFLSSAARAWIGLGNAADELLDKQVLSTVMLKKLSGTAVMLCSLVAGNTLVIHDARAWFLTTRGMDSLLSPILTYKVSDTNGVPRDFIFIIDDDPLTLMWYVGVSAASQRARGTRLICPLHRFRVCGEQDYAGCAAPVVFDVPPTASDPCVLKRVLQVAKGVEQA